MNWLRELDLHQRPAAYGAAEIVCFSIPQFRQCYANRRFQRLQASGSQLPADRPYAVLRITPSTIGCVVQGSCRFAFLPCPEHLIEDFRQRSGLHRLPPGLDLACRLSLDPALDDQVMSVHHVLELGYLPIGD